MAIEPNDILNANNFAQAYERLTKAAKEADDSFSKSKKTSQDINDLVQKQIDMEEALKNFRKNKFSEDSDYKRLEEEITLTKEQQVEILKKTIGLNADNAEHQKIITAEQIKYNALKEKLKILTQDQLELAKDLGQEERLALETTKKQEKQNDNLIAQQTKMNSLAKSFGQTLVSWSQIGLKGFNLPFVGVQIKGLMEITKDILTAPAAAYRQFGNLSKFGDEINGLTNGSYKLLGTQKDLYDAYGNLNKVLPEFAGQSVKTRQEIGLNQVFLVKAGFSAATLNKSMFDLVKTFNMTPTAANKTTTAIATLGKSLGVGEQSLSDFTALSPKLVGFGNKAQEVFTKTEIASKKLGIAATELFDSMDRFGTFESAANAAGELNLALGGQFINPLELMQASLEKGTLPTLKLLQKGFEASGQSVDHMSRAMIKFQASSLGMSEDSFVKAMRKSGSDLEDFIKNEEKAAADHKITADKFQDVFMQMQAAFADAFTGPKGKETIAALKSLIFTFRDIIIAVKPLIPILGNVGVIMGGMILGTVISVISKIGVLSQGFKVMGESAQTGFGKAAMGASKLAFGIAAAASVVMDSMNAMSSDKDTSAKGKRGLAGAAIGAALGGALAFIPGAQPFAVQLIAGGAALGSNIASSTYTPEPVQDAASSGSHLIKTPAGKLLKTDPEDIVVAMKKGNSGNSSSNVDKLVSLIEQMMRNPQPISVQIDGREVVKAVQNSQFYNPFS